MKIEIQLSNNIEYSEFYDYYRNVILDNSENTYKSLIEYTNSLFGSCKLFLPENGIHLQFQQTMINDIIKNNNITELIIFTHAPSIASKGWMDKIKFI